MPTPSDPGSGTGLMPPTEAPHPLSAELDTLDTPELLRLINDEDATVAAAVRTALPQLARLVEAGVEALSRGGRVHYYGAGAGGRIALGDALELGPTYGIGPETVLAHLAGGPAAAARAAEDAEDSVPDPADPDRPVAGDLAIGVTASGRTPYVLGALAAARAAGATTALLSGDPAAPAAAHADLHVLLATGPEVITGSTRMKAGTAQKLALNAFSTALMVRTGRTWSNLMVTASARNGKLRDRAVRTLVTACQSTPEQAAGCLDRCAGETATALVALSTGASPVRSRTALAAHGGRPFAAIRALVEEQR
ncbi:N-acetylmuramic acid 6-phosphate etherase [Kitasatospora phosalacinea]|uniref:N-acetylmuramic acid 6-phosphate etherase n=1 Tax=Kitasatospora phosalacinea TaxID=2065 RepID=A0A9W6Q673_9ACTN|nr:N-acetylmuramic acid 6-phosphate etherase [Kitasatospora phosalacinea]GLW70980.1 N-acetylmuramic acid 6-phosphate etherase [Kitasatospora phosalacinea]